MFRVWLTWVVCGICLRGDEFTGKTISAVVGVPATLPLETRAGETFDPAKLRHDLHTVWQTGRVSDVQIEALPDGDAVRLVFRLKAKTTVRLRRIRVDPPTPGVRVQVEPGAEIDAPGAQQVASEVRKQLESSGSTHASVQARLIPVSAGVADLEVHVDRGRAADIASVAFSGEPGVKPAELKHALRATASTRILPGLPGLWKGWTVLPAYNSDAVESDLANLRSFYYRRGYFDADVRLDSVEFSGDKAHVRFAVDAGSRAALRSVNWIPLQRESRDPVGAVCREFFQERREAERRGVLDFAARLEIEGAAPWVDATTATTSGPAYRVDRIEFRGNHSFSDRSLRRTMLVDEGAPLDQMLLRKSLARLNRNGWFEPLTERNVALNTPPGSDRASVTIAVKEKKARSWSFSGPVGPMSVGGSLHFGIGSRLPPWGRGILELSTYAVSLNFFYFAKPAAALLPFLPNSRFLPLVTLQRQLLPGQRWLSGFAISPQLGWQGMLAGYGVSQTRNWVQGTLQTDRALTPDLLVTVAHDGHEGTLRCEPPKARFDRARQLGGIAANLLFSFAPL
jgi:hypothetical protein